MRKCSRHSLLGIYGSDTFQGSRSWWIEGGGRRSTLDLCERHAAPLVAFQLKAERAAPPKPVQARTPVRRQVRTKTPVATIEEIEALKAARAS